ncbi:MAG: beta-propeller domain-containing protein, partial [Thermoplasmata archaeon]
MMMRKKMILATIVVGMALFVNLTLGSMDNEDLVIDQREHINEPEESFYRDYAVVKGEDGRLLLIPRENIDEIETEPFVEAPSKSRETPFIEVPSKSGEAPFIEHQDSDEIGKFSSIADLRSYLENHTIENSYGYYGGFENDFFLGPTLSVAKFDVDDGTAATTASTSSSHSTTNVQVTGVDEGDIVKTDGEYAYILSKDRCSVFIADVNPPEDAVIVSTINTRGNIREIYVKDDTLVIIGQRAVYQIDPSPNTDNSHYYSVGYDGNVVEMDIGRFYYLNYIYYQATFIDIFDLSVKEEPELVDSHLIKGSPVQSRMIGDFLYVITSQYIYRTFNEYDLPVEASDIYFLNGTNDTSYFNYYMQLSTILSIDITNPSEIVDMRVLLMDYASNIYVSRGNIYVTYYKYDYENNIAKTRIHRILIDNGMIVYEAYGEIEGTLLNRFSMDEHKGYFRVAASIGRRASHRVYVLDMDLNIVGTLQDIAPNEQLYSARFMGDRAYLVTFVVRTGDPFFVIDLSDPENPELLGELHIPGWSDYLHPYDENHVIGLGREAVVNGPVQGIKLSL